MDSSAARNELIARHLRRTSLSEQAANVVRRMILTGELMPGRRVTQDEIAAILGVSTMPVREALLRLAHEGLVIARPSRSFEVVSASREEIRDVFWMHSLLQGELAYRACRRRPVDLLPQLRRAQEVSEAAISVGDTDRMDMANWELHRVINEAAGSKPLIAQLRRSLSWIPTDFYTLLDGWAELAQRGHRRIVEAFERDDAEEARRAASEHVAEAGDLLLEHFTDHGYWSAPTRRAAQ